MQEIWIEIKIIYKRNFSSITELTTNENQTTTNNEIIFRIRE